MNNSAHHHCDSGKLPCFSTNQCIPKSKWCDSNVDCVDASDESACSCKARVPESRICDGFIDCPMASDELGCFGCDQFQYSCYSSRKEFEESGQVSASMCYSSTEKCDGFNNCMNGKDETECSMIVKNIGSVTSYSSAYSEGILHRNYKGRWYPVCKNSNKWALEACDAEVGMMAEKPMLSIKSVQMGGPFIQPSMIEFEPTFTDECHLDKIVKDENHIVFVKCPPPTCGISNFDGKKIKREAATANGDEDDLKLNRIVGGNEASPMEFPFIVAIYKDGNFHCGGSIYNEHWVITAAHCTKAFENHYYEVRAGILRRASYSPMAQIVKVTHVLRHENYERATMHNDIALMRVKHHFNFNKWVRPICLPSKERMGVRDWMYGPEAGTICTTLGWGAIREKGPDREKNFAH
jgi:Trypsin/Low-density lipoprotein receptor domain class A